MDARLARYVVLLCLAASCKRSGTPEQASAAPSASAKAPQKLVAARCKPSDLSYTVGQPGARAPVEPEEQPVGEPFAVELGSAAPHADGFAVGALELRGQESHAGVAILSASGSRTVELGRVHGDVEPPHVAARDGKLVAVVPDADAAGITLRVAVIHTVPGKDDVTWGVEASEGRDESQVFDVEIGARRSLLVWDEYDKREARGLVRALSFDPNDPGNATVARTLSGELEDAEAPALSVRDNGFWIGWVSRQHVPVKNVRARSATGADAAGVLDVGRRVLRVAPLDEHGSLVSAPIVVSAPDSHVLVFDLTTTAGGQLLAAWRDDATLPGVESGAVMLARVTADGAVEHLGLKDEDIGAGAPALLVDRSPPKGAPAGWLALAGLSDATRLVALGAGLSLADTLLPESVIGMAEALSLEAGRMLVARPRGLAMDLEVMHCLAGRKTP